MILLTYKTTTLANGPNALGCLYDVHKLRATIDRTPTTFSIQELIDLRNIHNMMQQMVIDEDGHTECDMTRGEYGKRNSSIFKHHQIHEYAVGVYAENRRDAARYISASLLTKANFCQLIGQITEVHSGKIEIDQTTADIIRCENPRLYPRLPKTKFRAELAMAL